MQDSHVLFLGAGASVPLGFPASLEVVKNFTNFLGDDSSSGERRSDLLERISGLDSQIRNNDLDFDSESLYECLQGFSNPAHYLKLAGPFPTLLCREQPVRNLQSDTTCSEIRNLFEEYLIKTYYRSEPDLKYRIKLLMDRLLARTSGVSNWMTDLPDWRRKRFEVFTTNYDNVLETYADQAGQRFQRGYSIIGDNEVIFDSEEYERSPAPLNFYKLHGSVELSKLDNGKVIASQPPGLPGQTHGSAKIVSKVMVYGIDKNIIAEPYFDLLFRMKKRLLEAKKCTIVGYSFRDPWITQIIKDVAQTLREELRITYVDRTANSKVISKIPFLKKFIDPIDDNLEHYLGLPTISQAERV